MNSKTLKQVVSVILIIVMISAMIPVTIIPVAAATSGSCGTGVNWSLDTTAGTLTISGAGAMKDYSMFSNAPWYSSRSKIKSVVIENGVTSIGKYTFYYLSNALSVTIPDSVTSIGECAFYFCSSLAEVYINDNITVIGRNAFRGCSGLAEITVGKSVKTIGEMAFCECSGLINITLPKGLEKIDSMAFFNCSAAKTMTYCGTEAEWENVIKGSDWNYSCRAKMKFYDENGNPVVCTHATITNGVCEECGIIVGACGENLTWTLDKDSGVFTVSGTGAMYEYTSYKSFPWYNDRLSIKSIIINEGVTTVGSNAFYGVAYAESLSLPETLTSIGDSAFLSCYGLTGDLVIPENVTNIEKYAFYGCSDFTSLTILGNVEVIKAQTFNSCDFKSISLPEGLKTIENGAFSGCVDVRELTIPDSVTSIGEHAFYAWRSLTSITLPESLETVASNAFENCYRIVEIINNSKFNLTAGSTDCGGVALYAIEIHNGESKVANVDDYVFYTYNDVNYLIDYIGEETNITLPESYNGEAYEINDHAFYMRWQLKDISVSENVTKIGDYAFRDCSGLESIRIPVGVSSIGMWAFYGCNKLASIKIPNGVTVVEGYTFYNCSKLTSVVIPNSITNINNSVFYNCSLLKTIIYCGTEAQWNAVVKDEKWNNRVSATVQFHNYVDGVCTECGDDPNATECEHTTIENGLCTECKAWDGVTPVIFAAGVSLGEDLTINYYAYIPEHMYNVDMRFTMNDNVVIVRGSYEENENSYLFVFDGIAPQLMGDNIKAELVFEDEIIATKDNYSILQNAKNLLEDLDEDNEAVVLIKAMLNYGAAAQQYADYNSDAPVNSGYETDGVAPDASVSVRDIVNNTGDSIFKAAGVYFNNVNKLYVKITSAEKPAVSINGEEAVVESYGNGEWIVYTDGILVTDFDETFTFVITSNPQLPTLTYSINSYTYVKQGSENAKMRALAIATYAYGVAAEAFNK